MERGGYSLGLEGYRRRGNFAASVFQTSEKPAREERDLEAKTENEYSNFCLRRERGRAEGTWRNRVAFQKKRLGEL